jgi:pyridoxal 5'-phosphate synthase pdxT subunit
LGGWACVSCRRAVIRVSRDPAPGRALGLLEASTCDAAFERLPDAFEATEGGEARLETRLIVPGWVSPMFPIKQTLSEMTGPVFGLLDPLRDAIAAGTPVLGTCAGMILLARELDQDRSQPLLGLLDVRVRRNAFGRQVDSFDVALEVAGLDGGPVDVSFIRAPVVTALLSDDVEVLAEVEAGPVLVRQGHLWAAAFHPEVTGDDRLHAAFVAAVRAGPRSRRG